MTEAADTDLVRVYSDLDHPAGVPDLSVHGPVDGTSWVVFFDQALPGNTAAFVLGFSELSAPFMGGVLIPAPDVVFLLPLDGDGSLLLSGHASPNLGALPPLWIQGWMLDLDGPEGWSATQALRSP
jgi:hypothetical protein